MRVLGLSCHYHDSAAALTDGGRILAAAHEERFDRVKGSPGLPVQAINACLQTGGMTLDEIDGVAFYEKPFTKLERVLVSHLRAWPRSRATFLQTLPPWLDDRLVLPLALEREVGFSGPISYLPHHLAHAASAFLPSPFEEAAILTADGVGEWDTTTLGVGRGNAITLSHKLTYPDSLGLLYTAVTTWLGFRALTGEGKVMALAEYGEPDLLPALRELVQVREDGSFRLDRRAFAMVEGDRMFGPAFVDLFGPARAPDAPIEDWHRAMAASLQRLLEDITIAMARHLHALTGMKYLCMAGGVALNITATSRVLAETPFEDLFIQPAAGDAGGALGAALYRSLMEGGEREVMRSAALGPEYPASQGRRALVATGLPLHEPPRAELLARVARLIAQDRIVGWFQGRVEFGPRALGQRSILANPGNPDMKDILNERVKHREPFRPYGVSVLRERVGEFFEPDRDSPFMLQVARAHEQQRARIPAVVHANGTTRLQTVTREHNGVYHELISAFAAETGVPMVINTSFNDKDEPIVCTPEDAVRCFQGTELDALVIGDAMVLKPGIEG
ncbi:MAG: carbamoyltransferase N-terminal domain-containing protein [Pseudomonadota bacterium]